MIKEQKMFRELVRKNKEISKEETTIKEKEGM